MTPDRQVPPCPSVSVVLPTYNQVKFLPQALDSIFRQTWRDFELIVVNDGSTDDTARLLEEYQRRHAFTVIHQDNQKLPHALNAGFRLAQGRLLTWTSSDNVMLPSMLEVLVRALERHPKVGLVYADWETIDEQGVVTGVTRTFDHDPQLLLRENYINACFLYRRVCQDTVGWYDSKYLHAEDWEYWLRISDRFTMMHIPEVLYQYRKHLASLTVMDVESRPGGRSIGYQELERRRRRNARAWYWSKLKLEWRRFKRDHAPRLRSR